MCAPFVGSLLATRIIGCVAMCCVPVHVIVHTHVCMDAFVYVHVHGCLDGWADGGGS